MEHCRTLVAPSTPAHRSVSSIMSICEWNGTVRLAQVAS